MKNLKMLSKMLVLATNAHDGQFDKGGKPYILHCLKVMEYLRSEDEELQCIALGHDLVEDTAVTYLDLWSAEFSARVINGINALTKRQEQTYEEYKAQVFTNRDAMLVKLCDLRHNSDIRRLKGVTDKDIARIRRYHEFYTQIKERL
jgi:GTP diphosphokinase / guanosine-3',5'-bis(diphosphate) 3'-diphosphatase